MSIQSYQKLIVEGIRELPEAALVEIADFIYFVRLRTLEQGRSNDLYSAILSMEQTYFSKLSQQHLEEEFASYDTDFPRE